MHNQLKSLEVVHQKKMQKFSRTSGELHEPSFHGTSADFYRGQGMAKMAGRPRGLNGMVLELLYNISLNWR